MKSIVKSNSLKGILLTGTIISGIAFANSAIAQDEPKKEETPKSEIVIVTGTRIQQPGIQSASPITSIGGAELQLQQVAEPEKLLRALPSTIPGDGENVNNGTAGVTSVNLRALGANRNLVLMDGKRMVPYNINGIVDVSTVPLAMLQRVDVLTGGASTVYGSDAMSGVVNFILKKNFEGIQVDAKHSRTGDDDGNTSTISVALGSNLGDGSGNVALSLNYTKRDPVTLADRPFGLVGVDTASGAGADGIAPPAPAGCQGPNAVAVGGSSTTVPTRMTYMGGGGQFREDSTLGTNCSVFNFNPYNYYQTPQERYSATAIGHYDLSDTMTAYARATFAATNVRQQIAPSGVFGNLFMVPLMNPYLTAQARAKIIADAEAFRAGGGNTSGRWVDVNGNKVVDAADTLQMSIRRRTIEFGERSTTYDNNTFQFVVGLEGDILGGAWHWDVSTSMGQADRTNISAGYTNVANVQNALNATTTTACANGESACVPIDLFGGFGDITPAMAAYSAATAIEKQSYQQSLFTATVGGPIEGMKSPFASSPVGVSFGFEHRREAGETVPDECLKLAPTSCLGGAGGNTLPIAGNYNVNELFTEASVPLVNDKPFIQSLGLELGYRWARYSSTGSNTTWKVGLDWAITGDLRFRAMKQQAARAPNIGELFAPLVTGLRNATMDPCSIAQSTAGQTATLRTRCLATGMSAAEVFTVQDIAAGQINTFEGSNQANPVNPEVADTLTVGFVWRPKVPFLNSTFITLDYYDINIKDYIGIASPQEILDDCYGAGNAASCAKIVRVNGDLATPGAGIQLYTQNLEYNRAEGFDLGIATGFNLSQLGLDQKWGSVRVTYNASLYTKNESQTLSVAPVLDCLGVYSTSCDPVHEFRSLQRTIWSVGDWQFSYLWRHLSELNLTESQKGDVFDGFEHIDAHDYFDLAATWDMNDSVTWTFSVANVFDKDPPIIGNETGTTSYNSGNTFPSNFDTLGRVYALGVSLKY